MMNEKIYQYILDEIIAFFPNDWEKTVVYLEYGENSYSFCFYCKVGKAFVQCYDISGVDEDKIDTAFQRIDKRVSKERHSVQGQLWSNMTMTVDCDGNMSTDFDYSDLSTGLYNYKKAWKKKYLV